MLNYFNKFLITQFKLQIKHVSKRKYKFNQLIKMRIKFVINQKISRIFCNFFNIENRESLVYKKCKSRKQNLIDLKNQSFEDNQEHSF